VLDVASWVTIGSITNNRQNGECRSWSRNAATVEPNNRRRAAANETWELTAR
jgi:hypothetical protein